MQDTEKNTSFAQRNHIVKRNEIDWERILTETVDAIFGNNEDVAFSVAIDASKVAKCMQIDFRYNAILGGATDANGSEFLVNAVSDDDSDISTLKATLCDASIIKADEVKVATVVFQNTGEKSPLLILACRPQTTNEKSDFNDRVCKFLQQLAVKNSNSSRSVTFLNSANDGVSTDKDHVINNITDFLRGEKSYLGTTDLNHNGKNARYQLIGFNSIVTIGNYVFDVGILIKAGVSKELIRISDWASDYLVLNLSSHNICEKVLNVETSDISTKCITLLTLCFQRAHLFAINCKQALKNTDRVKLLWSSLIYFLHLHGVSIVTKRNWIMCVLTNSFLLMRSDVVEPHRTTSEPVEHVFGNARSIDREFTVKTWGEIVRKIHERFRLMYKNDFQRIRNKKKGYASLEVIANDKSKKKIGSGGPVKISKIDEGQNHSSFIWRELRTIINEVNNDMEKFLKLLGVQHCHCLCKQFKKLDGDSAEDLLNDFLCCMN